MTKTGRWITLFTACVLVACLYALMEWLFFLTKPSFLSAMTAGGTVRVLFISLVPLALCTSILPVLLFLLSVLMPSSTSVQSLTLRLAWLSPAVALSCLFLVSTDVFTKTVLGFGVAGSAGIGRAAYGAYVLVLLACCYTLLAGLEKSKGLSRWGWLFVVPAGVFLTAGGVLYALSPVVYRDPVPGIAGPVGQLPNILLFSGDGLSASNLSVYGYERDTTPYLRRFADEALVCDNAFPNAGPTGASIASMFTGRLPTQTRLIYPPEILRGKDAYRHLPGLLGRMNYRRISLSLRHYADPFDLNMREAFDEANFRKVEQSQVGGVLSGFLDLETAYFLEHVVDRGQSRLFHILGLEPMVDPFASVQDEEKRYFRDQELVDELIRFIDASDQPFFAHIHLVGTHGPQFRLKERVFSRDKEQLEEWDNDFYDDAILQFDRYAEEVLEHLKAVGKYDNSLIVVLSDHAQRYQTTVPIPLLFRFPGLVRKGRVTPNTQLLDVAPTILDALGVDQPPWMGGTSLFRSDPDSFRSIMSADRRYDAFVNRGGFMELDTSALGPPFYSLRFLRVGICDKFFQLDLSEKRLTSVQVPGHNGRCEPSTLPNSSDVKMFLLEHLEEQGYATESIRNTLKVED